MSAHALREIFTLVCTRCSRGSEITVEEGRTLPRAWPCDNCGSWLEIRGRRRVVHLRAA